MSLSPAPLDDENAISSLETVSVDDTPAVLEDEPLHDDDHHAQPPTHHLTSDDLGGAIHINTSPGPSYSSPSPAPPTSLPPLHDITSPQDDDDDVHTRERAESIPDLDEALAEAKLEDVHREDEDDRTTTERSNLFFVPERVLAAATASPNTATPITATSISASPIATESISSLANTTIFLPSTTPITTTASSVTSSSPSHANTSSPSSSQTDTILTPRTLARKISAHKDKAEDEDLMRNDDASNEEAPSYLDPTSITSSVTLTSFDDTLSSSPRFACVVGGYKLKGEGLDTHTRYEVVARFKRSVVEESTRLIKEVKGRKESEEDAAAVSDSSSSAASAASSSPTTPSAPLLKIPATSKVARRYSDFITLQQLLTQLYPSYLIPCLPPKGLLQRFDEDFIVERRVGLQRFLYDVSLISVLAEERLVTEFLILSTRDWEAAATQAQQKLQMNGPMKWLASGASSLSKMIGGAMSLTRAVSSSSSASAVAAEQHATDLDPHHRACAESAAYHTQLNTQYDSLSTAIEDVVAKEHMLAEAWLLWYDGFEAADDSVQATRISHTHDLLGLTFAQLLPLTQRIGLLSGTKSAGSSALIALLKHTALMATQMTELFRRRSQVAANVAYADSKLREAEKAKEVSAKKVEQAETKAFLDEDERRAADVLTCAAHLRDAQSALTAFHTVASHQIHIYTTQRRSELKQAIVEFIQAEIAHQLKVQGHFEGLLEQMKKGQQQ